MGELFNEDALVYSAAYAVTMENEVLPYLKARQSDESVAGFDGSPLFVSRFKADENRYGTVFIVHGFTENAVKYSEIIFSLLKNGFSVVAYDQRGHGRSARDRSVSDKSLTHVGHFYEYVRDLGCVCAHVKDMPKPWKVFCHSMGGAVTSLFLMENRDTFGAAAMCAPMIAVNRRGKPYFLSKLICRAFKICGKGNQRLFFTRPYSGRETFEGACATGEERFEWYSDIKHGREDFHNNSPSYSWMLASLQVSQKLLFPGNASKIACPVVIYSAEDDWEVINKAQAMFARRLKHGKLVQTKGTRHEIYRSYDEALFSWWHEVLDFLKEA